MMDSEKKYPAVAKEYKLYEEVGEGVSATVYRALCIPANEIVAIKVLDLEKCNSDLDGIRREVQTMNLIDHPNVLRAYCSFTSGYSLWIVMPYMAGGSCLHIMKSAYPEGFEEPVIATLLKETLKALVYLHSEGHIHRDVKAGNILMDTNGSVKLADFGVSACMFDTGDRQRSRNTFVGTPCWMAPEVMQQLHGYDFKADIWSFGITALELAHGHAPFSKYPPMKVLLMTLQNAPPGLDYERDKRFSKSFKELVAACLVKDPKKRPTSEKLLKHHFFKHARTNDYISRTVLDGLHPLGERFKIMKAKDADLLIQNKARYGDMEQLSQKEYIKGISAWNFNLDDLKNQAAMIQDDHHVMTNMGYDDKSMDQHERKVYNYDDDAISTESLSLSRDNISDGSLANEDNVNYINDVADSLAAFPLKPLQALTECFDFGEEDISAAGINVKGSEQRDSQNSFNESQSTITDQESERYRIENAEQCTSFRRRINLEKRNFSGPLLIDNVMLPRKMSGEDNRDLISQQVHPERNYSGPLLQRIKKENIDDASEAVVKHKGRFKVTSAELSPKGSNPGHNLFNSGAQKISASSLISSIQSILQQNTAQRDEINKLMKYLEQPFVRDAILKSMSSNEMLQISREKELQALAMIHEQSIKNLTEELQKLKSKNLELEELLNSKRQSGNF